MAPSGKLSLNPDIQMESLLRGIPHSLLLANDNQELHVLVANVLPVRPFILASPFSTELVLDRSGKKGKEWIKHVQVKYFMYPVHISMSFLFTPSLSSALYLLLLKMLHRDYEEAHMVCNSIATDARLNEEEEQIFRALRMTCTDHHPDAHANRLKVPYIPWFHASHP